MFWKKKPQPKTPPRREGIGDATTMEDAALFVAGRAKDAKEITRFVWNGFDCYAYPNESPQQIYNRLDGIIFDDITAGVM